MATKFPSGVAFEAAPYQEIGMGEYKEVPYDLLIVSWWCEYCDKEETYDPPKVFGEVFEKALTHERNCQLTPVAC
jgi:hypothetical protein